MWSHFNVWSCSKLRRSVRLSQNRFPLQQAVVYFNLKWLTFDCLFTNFTFCNFFFFLFAFEILWFSFFLRYHPSIHCGLPQSVSWQLVFNFHCSRRYFLWIFSHVTIACVRFQFGITLLKRTRLNGAYLMWRTNNLPTSVRRFPKFTSWGWMEIPVRVCGNKCSPGSCDTISVAGVYIKQGGR